jgi:hypothetical protein
MSALQLYDTSFFAADFDTIDHIVARLAGVGTVASDSRALILGVDSRGPPGDRARIEPRYRPLARAHLGRGYLTMSGTVRRTGLVVLRVAASTSHPGPVVKQSQVHGDLVGP